MLIDDLIRLGQPLVNGGLRPMEILRIVTDVHDQRAKNFFRNVIIAELPQEEDREPKVWITQLGNDVEYDDVSWSKGAQKRTKKTEFRVNANAIGIPFSLPSGGNPIHPQGCYGLPLYPCWGPHIQWFRESADKVRDFLEGRMERTPGFAIPPGIVDRLCQYIHDLARTQFRDDEKRLGVLVLVQSAAHGFYYLSPEGSRQNLGESKLFPGRFIEPNFPKIVEAIWTARLAEGAEMGACDTGMCTVTGASGRVVSAYCKSWAWAFPTWTCPVPQAGNTELLIAGIALSPDAYRHLTMGACVINRLTRKVRPYLVQELFSPAADGPGRELTQRRNVTDLDTIYGAGFLLPIEDRLLSENGFRSLFAEGMLAMLHSPDTNGSLAERQLVAVTGFDLFLPEDFEKRDFSLTLLYFSGDPSRGDIHLRAWIADVLPSVARQLQKLALTAAKEAKRLFEIVHLGEKRQAYLFDCYKAVPYLLVRGYGGAHLWDQLESALHRRSLGVRRVIRNAAARMASLAHHLPDSHYDLGEEAIFYLCCREFISNCNTGRATLPEEDVMTMRPWCELLHAVEKGPIEQLHYENAAELGFGCGALVRQFSRMYWTETKSGEEGKDYLKHRVLTFGADLTPEIVWKAALRQMFEVAKRYDNLRSRFELFVQDRVGVTLTEFDRLWEDQVRKSKDEFMTAFWAGYSLQGYDVPKKTKSNEAANSGSAIEGGEA